MEGSGEDLCRLGQPTSGWVMGEARKLAKRDMMRCRTYQSAEERGGDFRSSEGIVVVVAIVRRSSCTILGTVRGRTVVHKRLPERFTDFLSEFAVRVDDEGNAVVRNDSFFPGRG